ncbi:hypothetical protein PCASD_21398 [Puccinia coronata f. sp. avenae]|uniref:Uncharacterized protein n=1 Tax=Puccinia coronata f. sp. avenae TaxID=200324 RepID=A0A2N5TYN1_9BASI|nr:hypothetical protein PCASD_21398 [Puccinia coronata f. sp. avenae]
MPTVSSGVPKLHCGWDPVSHDVRKQVHLFHLLPSQLGYESLTQFRFPHQPGSIQLTRTTLDHLGFQLFPKLFSVLFRVHIPTPRFTRTYVGFQSSPNSSPDLRLFFSGLNDKQAHPDTSPKQQASPHAAKPTDLNPSKPIKKITWSYRRKRTVELYPDIPSDKPRQPTH